MGENVDNAPDTGTETHVTTESQSKSLYPLFVQVAWLLVGAFGLCMLALGFGNPNGFGIIVAGGCLVTVTAVGLYLKWGCIIPCTALGAFVFLVASPASIASGAPIVGAVVGFGFGMALNHVPRIARAEPEVADE